MAAMLVIAGQAYLFTNSVLCEYTDAIYDKTNDLYHFGSYFKQNVYLKLFFCAFFLNSKIKEAATNKGGSRGRETLYFCYLA